MPNPLFDTGYYNIITIILQARAVRSHCLPCQKETAKAKDNRKSLEKDM
jgi:hypothetical protein